MVQNSVPVFYMGVSENGGTLFWGGSFKGILLNWGIKGVPLFWEMPTLFTYPRSHALNSGWELCRSSKSFVGRSRPAGFFGQVDKP